jgi:carbon monoxide dehydrogenase subunit G
MNPDLYELKAHPKLVRGIKILNREGDSVTWEQHLSVMGVNLHSTVKSSLDNTTNTIETYSIEGAGKGTHMTRAIKEIETGTEVRYTYRLELDPLRQVFLKNRAKKGFEETVDEDMKFLDALV